MSSEKRLMMKELIDKLNYHTEQYNKGTPEITDKEWDADYFRLIDLEKELGISYSNSPTQKIRHVSLDRLAKVKHDHPMLSLAKTKSTDEIGEFVAKHRSIAMLKLDGLTCSLTYDNGELVRAETRGNGWEGDDITHNVKVIPSVPLKIKNKDRIVVDGEIICMKKDFEEFAAEYKNARNFAAGSIRLLSSEESQRRNLTFVAWDCVSGMEAQLTLNAKLVALIALGFHVVPWSTECDINTIDKLVAHAESEGYPIDGIVYKWDICKEYVAAGHTDHHFRGGLAYKFHDEEYETRLIDIEYTMGRTGVLTPVAIYAPVEIEGSTNERASLHNLSVMNELLGIPFVGQPIWIYKANEIIPQVKRSLGAVDGQLVKFFEIPKNCPICGAELKIKTENESSVLVCTNEECEGKLINRLEHIFGKKGLDIKGLSKATFEKLIDWGWVSKPADVFALAGYRSDWVKKPGFGDKSVDRILDAIEAGRAPTLSSFICALGIPMIGRTMSKELVKHFKSYEDFKHAAKIHWNFADIDGIADEKMYNIWKFDFTDADALYDCMTSVASPTEEAATASLERQIICITGKLTHFKNRSEFQSVIEAHGGKVTSSVSSKTTWLVNNDVNSTSSKNVSAQRLGIPIITEEEFINQFFGE